MNDILGLNNEIIIHGRNLKKITSLYGSMLYRNDVKCFISDINDDQIFVGGDLDYIIHTAMPPDLLYALDPVLILNTAIKGTENISALCTNCNVKSFVYLSSITVYGNIQGALNIDEKYHEKQDWQNDYDTYVLGKRAAEFVLFSNYRNHHLSVKIL